MGNWDWYALEILRNKQNYIINELLKFWIKKVETDYQIPNTSFSFAYPVRLTGTWAPDFNWAI